MEKITPEQAREWKERWKAMDEVHAQELREMTMERKLSGADVIFWPRERTKLEREELHLAELRWLKLKRAARG